MSLPRDLQISIADIRRAGFCARLAAFFRENGLRDEYAGMLKGGTISSGKMLDTGDPRAVLVVERTAGVRSDG